MAHDVFISYSSEDKAVADAVCATLENKQIRCWIAPRDVPPGKLYGASLINAVKSARVMVLVLSEDTNQSEYVVRELNEAVAKGITIIPFRIEEVEPSEKLGFYINSIHWLDAMDPPLERYLKILADKVQAFLAVREEDQPRETAPVFIAPAEKQKSFPVWLIAIIGLAVVIVLGVIGLWVVPRLNLESSSPTSTTVALAADPTELPTPEPIPSTELSSEPGWSDWRPLTFDIPNEIFWNQPEGGSYTAVSQQDVDTFAWSDESFAGDFSLNVDITTEDDSILGYIIVYGDGSEFSNGNLIFHVGENFAIAKESIYFSGDNWLIDIPSDMEIQPGQTYHVTMEVIDDQAALFVDGRKVASARFEDGVNKSGKIALLKHWIQGEVTFSNIEIRTKTSAE